MQAILLGRCSRLPKAATELSAPRLRLSSRLRRLPAQSRRLFAHGCDERRGRPRPRVEEPRTVTGVVANPAPVVDHSRFVCSRVRGSTQTIERRGLMERDFRSPAAAAAAAVAAVAVALMAVAAGSRAVEHDRGGLCAAGRAATLLTAGHAAARAAADGGGLVDRRDGIDSVVFDAEAVRAGGCHHCPARGG